MNALKRQVVFEFEVMKKPAGLLVIPLILEFFFKFLMLFCAVFGYETFIFMEVINSYICFLFFTYMMMLRFWKQEVTFLFFSERYLPVSRKDKLLGKYALLFLAVIAHNLINLLIFLPASKIAQGELRWFHLFAEITVSLSTALICGGLAFIAVSFPYLLLSLFAMPALFFYGNMVIDWIEKENSMAFFLNLLFLPILALLFFFITLKVYKRLR